MRVYRILFVVLASCLFVGELQALQTQAKPSAAAPAKPQAAPAVTVKPDAPIQEIMATMIDPASKVVFQAVSSEMVNGKEVKKEPRTDAEWARVTRSAQAMVDGSKLITEESRRVARNLDQKANEGELNPRQVEALLTKNRAAWNKYARAFSAAAGVALKAAQAKNPQAVFDSGEGLDAACENCHLEFWYPDQEKLFQKKPAPAKK